MIKAMYVVLGSLFLGLGVLGIILPVLPTTPFLLLTVYFYAKGSERFHRWFINTWLYKRYLEDFVNDRSMTRKDKWKLMLLVDAMLLFPFITVDSWWLRGLIVVLVLTKYWYFFTQVETKAS
ncbi:MAG: YbaN family protein [Bacillota bacterium]